MRKKLFDNVFSSWDLLAHPLFRIIWVAALASNIGTWMQSTGGAWVMTSLTSSSVLIAMMQTATSLPVFFLGLPAGALANIVDRRKLLIFSQIEMLIAAALLAFLTFVHIINPLVLLLLTFALGIGAALMIPAWMAAVPETVDKKDLVKALALNSVAYNMSIAIGPALAGFVLSKFGAGWVFSINALSFLSVIYALVQWKRQPVQSTMPSEELVTAVKAGYRYLQYSPMLQRLVIRNGIFMLFASSFWGLFPSLARFQLHASAAGFGVLYGFMGIGTVIGATVIPQLQEKITIDKRIIYSTSLYALGLVMLVFLKYILFSYAAMLIIGFAWMIVVSAFNVHVQSIVAGWVKARAIGVYMVVFQGGLALGSLLWGIVALHTSLTGAVVIAVIGLLMSLGAAFFWPLHTEEEVNTSYSFHWLQPGVMPDIHPEKGPVLITNSFEVEPSHQAAFLEAASKLKDIRLRDGAIRWGIFRDTEDNKKFMENFIVESWAEHLRQHARATVADKAIEDAVYKFNKNGNRPITTHYIAEGYS